MRVACGRVATVLASTIYDNQGLQGRPPTPTARYCTIRISMLLSFTDTFFRKTFKLSKSPSRYCTGTVQGSQFTDKVFISTPMTPDRRPCVPCVPCVSRLPPVSFYRRTVHTQVRKFTPVRRRWDDVPSHGFASARPRHHPMAQNDPCVAV